MIDELKSGIVAVTFTKKDGSIREMICTLHEDAIPKISGTSKPVEGITVVYDLEADGWRSFRNDSVIDYKVLQVGIE